MLGIAVALLVGCALSFFVFSREQASRKGRRQRGLGSKADIAKRPSDVRFTPNSGHEMAIRDLRSLRVALEPKMSALPPIADIRQCD
jgi:hypothetical protein